MNAFVRQLVVLSVLWSFLELVLPDGKLQKLARFTVSVLVMTALVSALYGLLGRAEEWERPSAPALLQSGAPTMGETLALQAAANQARDYAVRAARKLGYQARATVSLRPDGALEGMEMTVMGERPLADAASLRALLAQAFAVDASLITVRGEGGP